VVGTCDGREVFVNFLEPTSVMHSARKFFLRRIYARERAAAVYEIFR
jgi:hypothetical protein